MIDDFDESNIGMPSTEWMIDAMNNSPVFADYVKRYLATDPLFDLQFEGLRNIMNKKDNNDN
jgi:hypothetical protein